MTLTVKAGTCAAPGATLYSGPLDGAAFGTSPRAPMPATATSPRGGTDNLCFAWDFPLARATASRTPRPTATFTFDAEQTANNP